MWVQDKVFSRQAALDIVRLAGSQKFALFYNSAPTLEICLACDLDMVELVKAEVVQQGYLCLLIDPEDDALIVGENILNFWMLDAPPKPVAAAHLFYLAPSYFQGFWTLEQTGLRNNSGRRGKVFKPENMPQEKAAAFFDRLRTTFVEGDKTKHTQLETGAVEIPDDVWAVALQGPTTITKYPVHFDYTQLVEKLIEIKGDKKLWLKPHPRMNRRSVFKLRQYHDPENGVYFGACNMHDLLAKSEMVFTRCSVVALEAMLHKVPAIVGGQVDFAHGVETITSLDQMETAIDAMRRRDFPYAAYLFWFLKREHLEPSRKAHTIHRIQKILGLG